MRKACPGNLFQLLHFSCGESELGTYRAPLLETAEASSWEPRGLVPVGLVSSEIWPCLSGSTAEEKPLHFLESRAGKGRRAG